MQTASASSIFGGIGWDWSERRIVQYFQQPGFKSRGRKLFINLLNREVIGAYANRALAYRSGISEEDIFVQLDYHNILFYLSVVHRLLEAVAQPTRGKKNRALLKAWEDAGARLARALEDTRKFRVEWRSIRSTDSGVGIAISLKIKCIKYVD